MAALNPHIKSEEYREGQFGCFKKLPLFGVQRVQEQRMHSGCLVFGAQMSQDSLPILNTLDFWDFEEQSNKLHLEAIVCSGLF